MIEIRTGKFGQYFHDTNTKEDLSLDDVRIRLNKAEEKTELPKVEVFYKIGDVVKILIFGAYRSFMICSSGYESVILIQTKGEGVGSRLSESVTVIDPLKISEDEMFKLSGKFTDQFTRVV